MAREAWEHRGMSTPSLTERREPWVVAEAAASGRYAEVALVGGRVTAWLTAEAWS
nr:hypothetical protein GCM10020063_023830 [Dactylosporangium thailandense]